MLSIVQLSRFLSFFFCDSFDILSNPFRFVKNFFIFLFCLIRFPFGQLQATACIDYHISKALSTVFFICFFSASGSLFFHSHIPGCSASASPADMISCGFFKAPSSATGAILSPPAVIVNVFSIFYLFQTIHTITANTSILFIFYFISICILPVQDFKPVRISTFLRKYIWKGTALPDKQP